MTTLPKPSTSPEDTHMNGHWDAFGVACLFTAFFLILVLLLVDANDRTADGLRAAYRARRELDYQRLHARFVARTRHALALADLDKAAKPVEVGPYTPVFTPVVPDDLDARFEDLMHRTFITDEEAR